MWYVVQVETGREKTACDDIKQAAEDVLDECFVPQYLTGKRRPDGTWIPSKERGCKRSPKKTSEPSGSPWATWKTASW